MKSNNTVPKSDLELYQVFNTIEDALLIGEIENCIIVMDDNSPDLIVVDQESEITKVLLKRISYYKSSS